MARRRRFQPERGWVSDEQAVSFSYSGTDSNAQITMLQYETLDDNDAGALVGNVSDYVVKRILLFWELRLALTTQPIAAGDRSSASRLCALSLTVDDVARIGAGADDPGEMSMFSPEFDAATVRILASWVGRAYEPNVLRVDADGDLVTGTTAASSVELWSGRWPGYGAVDISPTFNLREDQRLTLRVGNAGTVGGGHGWLASDNVTLNAQYRILVQKKRGA